MAGDRLLRVRTMVDPFPFFPPSLNTILPSGPITRSVIEEIDNRITSCGYVPMSSSSLSAVVTVMIMLMTRMTEKKKKKKIVLLDIVAFGWDDVLLLLRMFYFLFSAS